jgi:hypothetical protein
MSSLFPPPFVELGFSNCFKLRSLWSVVKNIIEPIIRVRGINLRSLFGIFMVARQKNIF